jgi:hypothetical protein
MMAIIVDVEYPNGDSDCTVRAAVDGDDVRFLSLKDRHIGYPDKADAGNWGKIVFVHCKSLDKAAVSHTLPLISGVSVVRPQAPPAIVRVKAQ